MSRQFTFEVGAGSHDVLESRIRVWLDFHVEMYGSEITADRRHRCSEELVAKTGTVWHANLWDMTIEEMEPGHCFLNAFMLTQIDRRLRYVEGWALTEFGLPAHHAWVVDPDGRVQDPTWKTMYRRHRDRDAARGSKQPYEGRCTYIGLMPADPHAHARWTIRRGHPNILALRNSDIEAVLQLGLDGALAVDTLRCAS